MLRGRQSGNIVDLRGMGGRGIALGGGGLGTIILLVILWLCGGGDLSQLLRSITQQTQVQEQPQQTDQQRDDEQKRFAASVLGSTEDVWNRILPEQAGRSYREPKLVLFSDQVSSACGYASSAVGPFYCPGDQRLYLDFAFFRELKNEFRAPGDFAQAYVIAHEVGHHVQNLLGTMQRVQRAGNSNELSVALELQADCYAGVWGFHARQQGLLEEGDIEEGLRAAAAVGDDMIQKRTQDYVVPESFTHGSARERASWFMRGFQAGDLRQCNTFGR